MYYTNSIKVTMDTNKAAVEALAAMRSRLEKGFDIDSTYCKNASRLFSEALTVVGETITLPEEFGAWLPEDAEPIIIELLKTIAEILKGESFICDACNYSDYNEGWIDAQCESGVLSVKTTYFPNGYLEYLCCEECGEDVILFEEYEDGKTYICPECGEEIDLSGVYEECCPQTKEISFQIL